MLVVTKGPVATAGSISSFLKINGITVPTVAATIMDTQMLRPTTIPREPGASENKILAKIKIILIKSHFLI